MKDFLFDESGDYGLPFNLYKLASHKFNELASGFTLVSVYTNEVLEAFKDCNLIFISMMEERPEAIVLEDSENVYVLRRAGSGYACDVFCKPAKAPLTFLEVKERLSPYLRAEVKNKPKFTFLTLDNFGNLTFRNFCIDENLDFSFDDYNDDLPHDKIISRLKNEVGGGRLMFFRGVPGTGKTTYLKYLALNYPEIEFAYIPANLFSTLSSPSFIKVLVDNPNMVYVLEDAELLIKSREAGNSFVTDLLQFADGVLGALANVKFIITFNSGTENIDKALLRRGRLFLNYEFKKLTLEKTNKKLAALGYPASAVEMTIGDIYNFSQDNGTKTAKQSKVI